MTKFEFMHYRNEDKSSGATVAILPYLDNTALLAISWCGPHDAFNKKIGRAVSSGRITAYLNKRAFMQYHVRVIDVPEGSILKKVVAERLANEMSEYGYK